MTSLTLRMTPLFARQAEDSQRSGPLEDTMIERGVINSTALSTIALFPALPTPQVYSQALLMHDQPTWLLLRE